MEENRCNYNCRAQEPYPEVRCEGRNQRYAEAMLNNMSGASSELSAVSLYFYDHLITAGVPEVAKAFHDISIVEMHHLEIFGTLAMQLGADPRMWYSQQGRRMWWSPDHIHYTRKLGPLMHNAVMGERATIRKYENQLRWIRDGNIQANLKRILLDEYLHVELLLCLSDAYTEGCGGLRSPLPTYYE